MDKTRGGPSVQRAAPLQTAVAHWLATNRRVKCDESNGRPALVRALTFRGVYDIVHSTEKQCSKFLTDMLCVTRGVVRPKCTPNAFVAKTVGADTSASGSEMQIHNQINKLNGTRKLRNAITNARWNPINGPITRRLLRRCRDGDSRARLRTLNIIVLTRIAILHRVYAMERTKTFDPTASGCNDSWRTLDWLARNCLGFSFYIGLTKQEVLEMLAQVHSNLKNSRWATQRGFMNRHTRQWTGPKSCAPMEQRASRCHHCQRTRGGHGTWVRIPGNRA